MEKIKYSLGLDIGIGSVGWCAINQEKGELVDLGVRIFDSATEAKDRRLSRSARRNLRRKKWRKQQLINAFNDFSLISKEEIGEGQNRLDYLSFTTNTKKLKRPKEDTVYHLRQKATKEQISKRELLLCLYNILDARGHFLLETIDFDKEGITFELYEEKVYEFLKALNINLIGEKEKFEKEVLKNIYNNKISSKDIKPLINNSRYVDEDDELKLIEIIKLLSGYKSNLFKLLDSDVSDSFNVDDLKKKDNHSLIEEMIIELYDISSIAKILASGCNYICDVAVNNIDELTNAEKNKLHDSEKYNEVIKKYKAINTKNLRAVRNLSNNYPNGLYLKEAKAILIKQQEYYKEITNSFIEVCLSIISAKIPYYIGPLNKDAKNAWIEKIGNFKYSYEYSKQTAVDEYQSIKRWKRNMISHCTYLPEEEALPKGSFIGETFSIINELNNYIRVKDRDNNDYYLTTSDKKKVFDELFLKKKNVNLKEIADILNLNEFSSDKGNSKKFNNSYSLYFDIIKILPELTVNTITEIFLSKEKINKLEQIILDINLFDEEKSKIELFKTSKEYNYSDEIAKALAKLKSKSFYSLSKKIIMEQGMNKYGDSMMELLFNQSSSRNNQMTILENATDKDGNKISFIANKYINKLKANNKLDIDLLINDGKPTMPISRPVIRALNESLKVYNAVVEIYGIPERLIIETARGKDSIKDFSEQNQIPEKHYKKMETTYNYINDQIKKNYKSSIMDGTLEDWKDLASFYEKNKIEIELYIRQDGIDLLTGKPIAINNLSDYEVDHILPRGFGDDSMDDKMLTIKLANDKKGDRLPIEFLESSDAVEVTNMTVGKYETIVKNLFEIKAISENKYRRLMLRNQEEAESFINQNLVDTRYIIKEFMAMISAYNFINNQKSHIVAMKASFTNLYRKALKFEKDRDLGNQHHAYDAAVVCIADKVLSQYYPNYDSRGDFKAYKNFVSLMSKDKDENKNKDNKNKLNIIIASAFNKAYGQSIRYSSLLQKIKDTTPLISYKSEKNWKGQFFDMNPLKPLEEDNTPLTIIGANNKHRSFSGVNCVCVDFYKVRVKNKVKHIAIHVPLAIVDEKGNINKDKYIKLIKEYYKEDSLLDEYGDIKECYFRLRMFNKDLFYDTKAQDLYLFNIGSIVNKKLEIKNTNIYSYNDIYSYSLDTRNKLYEAFNIKSSKNKEGINFSEINKQLLLDYFDNQGYIKNIKDSNYQSFLKGLEGSKNYLQFISKLNYLDLEASKKYAPPTIVGQNCKVVNNEIIKTDPDAQYVKIKSSILGVRFRHNDNGKLLIEGPNMNKQMYSRITHDKFSWKISKYSV